MQIEEINPYVALGSKKKPQLGFCVIKNWSVGLSRFLTFPEYGMSTKMQQLVILDSIGVPKIR